MMYQFIVNPKDVEDIKKRLKKENCTVKVETTSSDYYLRSSIEGINENKITLSVELMDFIKKQEELAAFSIIMDNMDKSIPVQQFYCIDDIEHKSNIGSETIKEKFLDTISDVSWMSGFHMGAGVDAITNIVHRSAVTYTEHPSETDSGYKQNSYTKLVNSSTSLSKLLSTELSGKYTVGNIELTNSFSYLKDVKYSDKELSIVIVDKRYETSYLGRYDFELSKEASDYLSKASDGFRDKYGDYFISDIRNGAYFYAVYCCKSSTVEELNSFKNDMTIDFNDISMLTSTQFQDTLKKHNIKLEVSIFYDGCDSTIPYDSIKDAIDVGYALKWYSQHLKYVPVYAKLTHYSCLPGCNITNTLPYDAEKLLEIKSLYTNLIKLYSEAQSVPESYNSITASISDIYDKIMMRLSKITNDDSYRNECISQITSMQKNLQIFFSLLAAKKQEPKAMEKKKSNEKLIWEYGCLSCDKSKIKTIHFVKKHGIGWQEKTIHFGMESTEEKQKPIIILGYKMISNWTDGSNGDWWKLSDHGILDHELNIHISSYYDRGCDWTIEISYIKEEDGRFNNC